VTISAKIIADSVSPQDIRLTTMQLRYPRFIHAEFMTHRVFSRNASSSRAIPVERLIEDIIRDTAMPIHWGKNQAGMQAREEHRELVLAPTQIAVLRNEGPCLADGKLSLTREEAWNFARDRAIEMAREFHAAGYHKQIVNRLLEPFSHINVVVTATEWSNFFALRDHPDAQPEIRELAQEMRTVMCLSTPESLEVGQWHLPYVPHWERSDIVKQATGRHWDQLWNNEDRLAMVKVSVARCARVSFLTHDGKQPDIAKDLELYERLVGSVPLHASPAEHQATPDVSMGLFNPIVHGTWNPGAWKQPELHGNLKGWVQFRKTLPNENQ
jgi:thymidylate synthase-like protein